MGCVAVKRIVEIIGYLTFRMYKMIMNFKFARWVLFFMAAAFSAQQVSADDFCSVNYFSCKIKGKQVALCGAELGDVYNIMFVINGKVVAEYGRGEKYSFSEHVNGKATLASVYFKSKDTSYALTTCDGMECNPDKSAWLSVVKGNKKIAGSGFCDAGTSSGFENLPLTPDKTGVYQVLKKSDDASNYFSIKKNPKELFLTENVSWTQ
jgi:hypothetical protein